MRRRPQKSIKLKSEKTEENVCVNKTVFIGDIHGDFDFVEAIDNQYTGWKKVFVGDYVDSHHWSPQHSVQCVNHILQMVERGDTVALAGNHELSYLFEGNRCSGWNSTTEMLLFPLRSKMFQLLNYWKWYPEHKILVTHGGITLPLWKAEGLTTDNLEQKLTEWKREDIRDSKFGWVGNSRGGVRPYGGPFWCDFDQDFQPVFGITQIFGHTPHRTIKQVGSNYDINQLEMIATREVLEFVDGTFQTAKYQVQWEDGRQQFSLVKL